MSNLDWPARIGWACFLALTAATLAGYHIVNSFAFGAIYYVFYQFNHLPNESRDSSRILLLGAIGLIFAFSNLIDGVEDRQFSQDLEKICFSPSLNEQRVCEEIEAALESSKLNLGSSEE